MKPLETILNEIYELDESLRGHDKELKRIVLQMIKDKPDSQFDENFKKSLRMRLAQKISELKEKEPKRANIFSLIFMRYAGVFAAGFAIALLVPFLYQTYRLPENQISKSDTAGTLTGVQTPQAQSAKSILSGENIKKLSDKAFGSLSINQPGKTQSSLAGGRGGGGGIANATSESAIAPAPDYMSYKYKFVYDGELKIPTEDKLGVFKRVYGGSSADNFSSIIKSLGLGMADFSSLKNLKVQSVSAKQDEKLGYLISADIESEQISIFADANNWPNPFEDCWKNQTDYKKSEQCQQKNLLKMTDIPADSELIKIASDFLKDLGISAKNYGTPYVNNDWKKYYGNSADSKLTHAPEEISVVFPTLVEKEMFYDAGGLNSPVGLNVGVNIRQKKASSLYNLNTQKYEKSLYETEKDTKKLAKMIENGGVFSMYSDPNAKKTIEIKLGAPTTGLMRYMNYKNNKYEELFIPVLIFPVKEKAKEGYFYNENIFVPLVKDVIRDISSPAPVPLLEKSGQ